MHYIELYMLLTKAVNCELSFEEQVPLCQCCNMFILNPAPHPLG